MFRLVYPVCFQLIAFSIEFFGQGAPDRLAVKSFTSEPVTLSIRILTSKNGRIELSAKHPGLEQGDTGSGAARKPNSNLLPPSSTIILAVLWSPTIPPACMQGAGNAALRQRVLHVFAVLSQRAHQIRSVFGIR